MKQSTTQLSIANFEFEVSDQGLRKLVWRQSSASRQKSQGEAQQALIDYFSGRPNQLSLVKLDFKGAEVSPRAQKVYRALQKTKAGDTLTYAQLAVRAGLSPKAARYVGTLMAKNPWPLFVPCHRVLPASVKKSALNVGHYSGGRGSQTKLELLRFEKAIQ
jgi:methylated-DNA-[protein]-cysteine S-methyltransferase